MKRGPEAPNRLVVVSSADDRHSSRHSGLRPAHPPFRRFAPGGQFLMSQRGQFRMSLDTTNQGVSS